MKAASPLLAAVLALALATAAPAQQTVNLRDADIRAYIADVSRATGRTFIIDPRVQGKVSVVSEQPLGRNAYFELFLATLRANGLIATPVGGGALRIQPVEGAASQSAAGSGRDRLVTEVFKLNSIESTAAVETLRPLVSREGQVTASRGGNAIIVVDYADNIARVRRLLADIDRDRQITRVVPLKNAGAREIAGSLTQLLNGGGGGGGGQGADTARSGVSVVAIDSSNAVALRGDPVAVARLAETVQDLDKRAAAGADVRVMFLAHADAEKLLPVLQQLVGQTPTPTTPQAGLGGGGPAGNSLQALTQNNGGALPAAVVAAASAAPAGVIPGATIGRGQAVIARFEGANAIVIAAPADVQRQLGEVIRQLDTRREQVLVEAIIVEISDLAAKKLGVQFLLAGQDGSNVPFAASNYSNASPNLLTIAGAVAGNKVDPDSDTTKALTDAAIATVVRTTGGIFGFGGAIGNEALFSFVINALKTDTASNVLSTPSIMTLDNQQARILVGQNVPITTGEVLSSNFDNPFRTVDRQDIGVQLDVRPQINAGGSIKLTLRQEVSSIAGPQSEQARELIINKREITTTVTVDDGQIIALGGLIDDIETESIEKVPLLGDIPGLGVLFRSKSRSKTKTNLMVFIRPSIIKSAADAQAIAADRYNYMRAAELAQRNDPAAITAMDELVRDYFRSTPPVNPYTQPAPVPPAPLPPAGPVK
jgi:general secretion pathway protein D